MLSVQFERWKWNPDFELYVSSLGHFRTRDKRPCPIKVNASGYCCVYAYGTTHRDVLCHRAVLLTWRPTCNAENLTVDHLDHNKRNNAVTNLEWVSFEENQQRAKADLVETLLQNCAAYKAINGGAATTESTQAAEKLAESATESVEKPYKLGKELFTYTQMKAIISAMSKHLSDHASGSFNSCYNSFMKGLQNKRAHVGSLYVEYIESTTYD